MINYDRHVKDLIDELDATGHVTHKKYKKTSVTLHHNGARLSHLGVLDVWKVRPASAQFDVDGAGDVAQYVRAHEYAWACGNTEGNMRSIHIEMCNKTGAPHYEIGEETWQSAARLAGWLFVHEVEGSPRPSRLNFFVHHHWFATTCAGPFVDSMYGHILNAAQKSYDFFRAQKDNHETEKEEPEHDGSAVGRIKQIQRAVDVEPDGKWGKNTDEAVLKFRKQHLIR